MAKEQDLNSSQSVADSKDLNNAQSVATQDLNASGQGEPAKLADGTDENKIVKYAELKKATDRATTAEAAQKTAEEREQLLQNQMAMMTANQQQARPVQAQQPKTTLEQAMVDCGVTAEEMYGDVTVKVLNRKAELDNTLNQRTAAVFANQQFESSHPDFSSAVGLRNPMTGQIQPTAEILKILTEKPHLSVAANASSQGAYEIVMEARKMAELQSASTSTQEHQKRIDAATQPLGGSAAGGVAGDANNQQMMTREQVLEIERKLANDEQV